MTIPIESSTIEDFTPASLTNLAAPPVFKLRPWTVRDRTRYQDELVAEGLNYHGDEELRRAMLDGLRESWSPDVFAEHEGKLRAYWSSLDDANEQARDIAPEKRYDFIVEAVGGRGMMDAVTVLNGEVTRGYPRYARMLADNNAFWRESPKVALSMFLVGWTGLDVPFRKEAGRCAMEALDGVEQALLRIEEGGVADKVEGVAPRVAFTELQSKALEHLGLMKEEEKNSDAPQPSAPNPKPSSTGTESMNGESPGKTARGKSTAKTQPTA